MPTPTPSQAFDIPFRLSRRTAGGGTTPESRRSDHRTFDDIDRLLRAIAENDPKYRSDAARNSGSVAAALDSITRWIDGAEKRFAELTIRNARSERLLAHVAMLAASAPRQGDILEAKQQAAKALEAAHEGQKLEKSRQACRRQRLSALTAVLERMMDMLQGLDLEIVRIEESIASHSAPLSQKIQELAAALDGHMRQAFQEAASSKQYFELMTGRIETFAEELRRMREMREGHLAHLAPLPQPAQQKQDVASGLPNSFSAPLSPKQPLSCAPETPAAIFSTEDEAVRIRSGLIAAARQANRSEIATDREAMPRPGPYFMRAETGKS